MPLKVAMVTDFEDVRLDHRTDSLRPPSLIHLCALVRLLPLLYLHLLMMSHQLLGATVRSNWNTLRGVSYVLSLFAYY
jgi:hypothetical protein